MDSQRKEIGQKLPMFPLNTYYARFVCNIHENIFFHIYYLIQKVMPHIGTHAKVKCGTLVSGIYRSKMAGFAVSVFVFHGTLTVVSHIWSLIQ